MHVQETTLVTTALGNVTQNSCCTSCRKMAAKKVSKHFLLVKLQVNVSCITTIYQQPANTN